jgi:hypothetical protein
VQAFDHPAAGPIQGGVVHGGAALCRDQQGDVMRCAAEHVRLWPVERHCASRLPVGAQRQHQATGESASAARQNPGQRHSVVVSSTRRGGVRVLAIFAGFLLQAAALGNGASGMHRFSSLIAGTA